jgi:hypothetical protein
MKIGTILLFCFTALPLLAQERIIEKKEFDDTYSNAYKKLEKRIFRSTYNSEWVRGKERRLTNRYSSVRESVPPDREHTTSISSDGETTHKFESIRIGDKFWERVNDGVWKFGSSAGSGTGSGSGLSAREIERKIEYKKISNIDADGIGVDHYQFRQRIRWETSSGVYDDVTSTDYWIRKDGLPVRYEHENDDAVQDTFYKTSTTWEYPERIRIEAPDIYEEKTKQ